ncbi:MAG: hypothetical protein ABSH46_00775 [Bryobacteraceae bacterium]|jgi:hypothetical protein
MKGIVVGALIVLIAILLAGQQGQHVRTPMILDWTQQHVLFSGSANYALMAKLQSDPRFLWQQLRRRGRWPGGGGSAEHRDWSVNLAGGVGGQTFPVKYVFDVTQAPSCSDFVVTGNNVAGSATHANIIGVNKLYTGTGGLCGTGTAPNVMFAYNVGPGTVPASVAVSLDGTKVAFIEDNGGTTTYFHVLTYVAGTNNGSATAPVAVPSGADVKLAMSAATTNTIFVDYMHDAAYATSGTTITKFSPVFKGTLAKVTTGGWPVTIAGAGTLSTPVYDQVTRHLFVEDTAGVVRYVDDSVVPAAVGANTWAFATTDTARPPIVDSANQTVYMYSPNGSSGSLIGQDDMTLDSGTGIRVTVGVGAIGTHLTPLAPDFSNGYYTGVGTPYLYAVGNNNTEPSLYRVGFTKNAAGTLVMNSTTLNGPLSLSTANADASSVTEFYNATTLKEYLFVGVSTACSTAVTTGCIRSLDITSGFPASANPGTGNNNAILAAGGGTSGITVDNNNSTSVGQAASIYYVTLTGNALVKSTQLGLN